MEGTSTGIVAITKGRNMPHISAKRNSGGARRKHGTAKNSPDRITPTFIVTGCAQKIRTSAISASQAMAPMESGMRGVQEGFAARKWMTSTPDRIEPTGQMNIFWLCDLAFTTIGSVKIRLDERNLHYTIPRLAQRGVIFGTPGGGVANDDVVEHFDFQKF